MRGGSRGRGRRSRGNAVAVNQNNIRSLNSGKIPFDVVFFDEGSRAEPVPDDSALTTALLKRNSDITPTTEETQGVQNLVTRIQSVLENLILTPGTFDACQVDEVRQVGSFKQGIILSGHKTADFVVILKTLPTKEAIEALSNKVAEELRQTECVLSHVTARGFDITSVNATVRVLITTVPHIFRKLDAEIHLDSKLMNEHWQAIRHSRWFEENAHHSTVKVLIRILRDIRQRFTTLQPLSTWMLDLLAHFATMNNPNRQSFPINIAFRRTIALIAGGMYLPGSAGTTMRGHNLTYEDQDLIAATGQQLLRVLSFGGFKAILGLEASPTPDEILFGTTTWNGVSMSPIEKVYEKPPEGEPIKVDEEIMMIGDEDTPMEAEN